MIGNMFKHISMFDKSISITFEFIKLVFSGSDQMLLNTLVVFYFETDCRLVCNMIDLRCTKH